MNNFQMPYTYPQYQPPTKNGITWVQGVEGAKAYQLMPNSNIMLLDSENDGIFYIKVSDNVGMCTLRTFKYEEVLDQPNKEKIDTSNFITRDEFLKEINELKGVIDDGKQTIQPAKRKVISE